MVFLQLEKDIHLVTAILTQTLKGTTTHLILLQEIEQDLKDKEPGLWNFNADISIASLISNNVNSVSKTRKQSESGEVTGFNSAMFDKTSSGGISFSATRPIGEESSFLANFAHTTSNQHQEHDDDFQSYGLTLGLDTVLGGQSLSPYFTISKSDYHTDADSFSKGMGIGGFFTVGERHSFLSLIHISEPTRPY